MLSWRETFEKVGRKPLIGALIALVLLALSGALSFRNARQLIAATTRVNGIHATIANERELLALLNQAESGLFGYIITGETNFLEPYLTATNDIPALIGMVRAGTEGHPPARAELADLEIYVNQRLVQMRHRIEVRRAGSSEAAADLIKTGTAKVIMDQIRTSIARLNEHELKRLRDMEEHTVTSAHKTLIVDVLFGTLSVLSLAAIMAWLMRENVRRRETEEELRKAGRELEQRVAQRTADLAMANASLQNEIAGHKRAEEALRASEAKLAEAALALEDKNKDLEMLIYVASHDLRAPLLNIRGFVSELTRGCAEVQALLERAPGDSVAKQELARTIEDFPESAGFIQAGVGKMDSLLSAFLRLSRLGRAAIRVGRVDMNGLLDTVAQSFEYQVRQAQGEIQIDRLPKCSGDVAQLTQVFSNLIDNAVKYRETSRPLRIHISATAQNGTVAYRVVDNGLGIPADHLQRVFEIFHRVNPREGEGEGLGLTIARRILDRLNGRLAVESAVGAGSVFTVHLPAGEREIAGGAR